MTMRTNCILLLAILLGAFPLNRVHADESGSIILYTPYTKISVTPGASIDYSIDLINNTDGITNANLSVNGLPGSWKHEIKSGGWTLSQLSVLPQEKKTFNLKVEVPLKVNKGSYHFTVFAGETKLPLEVVVAQKGTYQTEFTTDQPNMQGNSKSTFTFNATLKNQTADQQLYALMANAPRGWSVVFKPNYKQATSAQVEANSSQNVSIEIVPPANGSRQLQDSGTCGYRYDFCRLGAGSCCHGFLRDGIVHAQRIVEYRNHSGRCEAYRVGGPEYRLFIVERYPAFCQ